MAFNMLWPGPAATPPSPEVYWEYFRRLNVRQQLNVTELSVDAFLDQIEEPSDVEVEELFAAYREKVPGQDEPGSPGFLLPGRARIAWLELDYDAVEASVAEITDAEIEAHYNEHRDTRYRKVVILDPDESRDGDRGAAGNGDTTEDDVEADDAVLDEEDTVSEDDPNADAESPGAAETGDEGDPAEPESAETAAETPAGDTDLLEASGGESDGSDVGTESGDADTTSADPLLIPEAEEVIAENDQSFTPPMEIEYRELDDDLKNEIRDELLSERVKETIDAKMLQAEGFLATMARERGIRHERVIRENPDKFEQTGDAGEAAETELRTKLAAFTPEFLASMREYAEENEFAFAETSFLSYGEFRNEDDYPLGSAVDPRSSALAFAGRSDIVAVTLFSSFGGDAANNDSQLFIPRRAVYRPDFDEGTDSHFAYWAVEHSASHIPTLDEPGIRESVVLTLKRREARKLLQTRADNLVEKIRGGLVVDGEERVSMAAVLEGETITGSDDSATLLVRLTQPFSWMRTNQAAPLSFNSRPRAEISRIRSSDSTVMLGDIGSDFMKSIFEDLQDEEVGMVPNFNLTKYYIVHVTNRFPTRELGMDGLRDRFAREGQLSFLNTPVMGAMRGEIESPAVIEWERSVWFKYGVNPDGDPQ